MPVRGTGNRRVLRPEPDTVRDHLPGRTCPAGGSGDRWCVADTAPSLVTDSPCRQGKPLFGTGLYSPTRRGTNSACSGPVSRRWRATRTLLDPKHPATGLCGSALFARLDPIETITEPASDRSAAKVRFIAMDLDLVDTGQSQCDAGQLSRATGHHTTTGVLDMAPVTDLDRWRTEAVEQADPAEQPAIAVEDAVMEASIGSRPALGDRRTECALPLQRGRLGKPVHPGMDVFIGRCDRIELWHQVLRQPSSYQQISQLDPLRRTDARCECRQQFDIHAGIVAAQLVRQCLVPQRG